MTRSLYLAYPPATSQKEQHHIVETIKDWSISHGLAVRPPPSLVPSEHNPNGVLAATAPVTLFPSLFPKRIFEQCLEMQCDYSLLYAAISSDEAFIESVLKDVLPVDDFVEKLWKLHKSVKVEGYRQALSLGLFRSDYMVHIDSMNPSVSQAKQVEFNTIASSFGGLSALVSRMHKELLEDHVYPEHISTMLEAASLPDNNTASGLAHGLAQAHLAYGTAETGGAEAYVIFVVQEGERNIFDQRQLEYSLRNEYGVRSYRVPLTEATECLQLQDNDDRKLLYTRPEAPSSPPLEVSVVYYRAGYSPDDYTNDGAWAARLLIEKSRAVKCPSVLAQLAGTKKVQQVLATPGSDHVERLLAAADSIRTERDQDSNVQRIVQSFAPMYPMDDSAAGKEGRKLALDPTTATRYVLKPQREGGGNNIYRQDIPAFLRSIPESQWSAYILMAMIEPPKADNVILRNGDVQRGGVISELGVYGACLWRNTMKGMGRSGGSSVLWNANAGYLLRTKGDQSQEGGVAAGFGAIDSVALIEV